MKVINRSRGRPWVYNAETARSIAASIAEGASKKEACMKAGVAYSSFMCWQRLNRSLRRLVEEAEQTFVVIALIVVLEPDTARAISTEQVYNLLISSHILPNPIAGIGCFFAMYLLVGAIVLTSPTLWTHQPTP
jgi:hypothetical protein